MKKRNLKQFFKENWEWFALILWTLLTFACITYGIVGNSLRMKLGLAVICLLYPIAGIMILYIIYIVAKRKTGNINKTLQELKNQDKYYVDLVDRHVKETLNKFIMELINVDIYTSLEYLISFSNNVNWICNTRIVGPPDSFIIASCLMDSLIRNPVIKIYDVDHNAYLKDMQFSINVNIAMSCVFEIISEPSTYFEDNGIWMEEKHPKVNIVVPNGIIKNSELYERIINTIYHEEITIMEFSNLLHLIYLNCQ